MTRRAAVFSFCAMTALPLALTAQIARPLLAPGATVVLCRAFDAPEHVPTAARLASPYPGLSANFPPPLAWSGASDSLVPSRVRISHHSIAQPPLRPVQVVRVDTLIPPGGEDTVLVSVINGAPTDFQPDAREVRCAIRLGVRYGLLVIHQDQPHSDPFHITLKLPLTTDSVLVLESVAPTWRALLEALPHLSTIRLD